MRYEVKHAYASTRDGLRFGPWKPGEVVELEPADAEWILRDSPGSLSEAKAKAAEREQPPAADRQHRGGRNRGQ